MMSLDRVPMTSPSPMPRRSRTRLGNQDQASQYWSCRRACVAVFGRMLLKAKVPQKSGQSTRFAKILRQWDSRMIGLLLNRTKRYRSSTCPSRSPRVELPSSAPGSTTPKWATPTAMAPLNGPYRTSRARPGRSERRLRSGSRTRSASTARSCHGWCDMRHASSRGVGFDPMVGRLSKP